MGSELTSVRSILGLNTISSSERLSPASRLIAAGFSFPSRDGSNTDHPPGRSQKQAVVSRQPHPLLSIAQAIPNESAVDAGALGFMAKFLVQTTLPHSEQTGTQYVRTDGNFSLRITDVGATGLPYGSYPRLILIAFFKDGFEAPGPLSPFPPPLCVSS